MASARAGVRLNFARPGDVRKGSLRVAAFFFQPIFRFSERVSFMRRTKWFEREFDFSLPVGVFPCVVERLRGTPARLEEVVGSPPPPVPPARRAPARPPPG